MSRTLQAVGADNTDSPDERVRAVVRMLLAMRDEKRESLVFVLGISRSAVYAKMSGPSAFNVAELVALAEHFDVPPAVFLAGPHALISQVGEVSDRDKIVPGSIKDRGNVPGGSRHVTGSHLSLVAA
jgi:BetR domain